MLNCPQKDCSGCFACQSICPVGAIDKKTDEYGFIYPFVDDLKCVKCDACNKVCPILTLVNATRADKAIASWTNNEKIRQKSSSGGLFSELAIQILDNNGYVCGASFDENNKLHHIIISNKSELDKLRGSKYLQSDISRVYPQIKEILEAKNQVLFVGTPCQVAGLNSYLQKEYTKLITVDLVCHGVVSQAVFDKYLYEIIGENSKVDRISFRDKSSGWKQLTAVIEYVEDGKTKKYKKPANEDAYMKAFLGNLDLRENCSNCKFSKIERCSDITLGDFWGIAGYDKKLDKDNGTSLVLLNTQKGKYFFDGLGNIFAKDVPLQVALKGNITLSRPWNAHTNRKKFLTELFEVQKPNFSEIVENNLSKVDDIAIFNFCTSNNYGALLTTYALYHILKEKGQTPKVLHYVPTWHNDWFGSVFHFFALKYMDLSPICRSRRDLAQINNQFSSIIMGSDQVFRPAYVKYADDVYFLGWTQKETKRIAYSASFGVNTWESQEDKQYTQMVENCLQCFDAISVREKSGVNICKDFFDIDTIQVLDPVFLYNNWSELIKNATDNQKFNLAVNILDDDINITNAIDELKKKYSFNSIDILNGLTPENWLYNIKNCDLMITDSFHGVCFALIFKKQFVCILNKNRGTERIKSVLTIFNLTNRMIDVLELDKLEKLYKSKINYSADFEKFEELKRVSFEFLEKAMYKRDNELIMDGKITQRDLIINDFMQCKKNGKTKMIALKKTYLRYKIFTALPFGKKWKSKYKTKKQELKNTINTMKN